MKPFYTEKARGPSGKPFYVVMDALSKQIICRVRMPHLDTAKGWAEKIADALNKAYPSKD